MPSTTHQHAHSTTLDLPTTGLVRQCAWCLRLADRHGRYRRSATSLLQTATHGVCPTCEARLLATFAGRAGQRRAA